jgi:hypothetical protein
LKDLSAAQPQVRRISSDVYAFVYAF